MRQVDETNFEHDRVKKVETDLTKKLTAFIERINVKISALEAKVGSLMAPQAPKNDVITRYDPFDTPCETEAPIANYSLFELGSQVHVNGAWRQIIEITFDKEGTLYTLDGNLIIPEFVLMEKTGGKCKSC
jgi:hypothetical protein